MTSWNFCVARVCLHQPGAVPWSLGYGLGACGAAVYRAWDQLPNLPYRTPPHPTAPYRTLAHGDTPQHPAAHCRARPVGQRAPNAQHAWSEEPQEVVRSPSPSPEADPQPHRQGPAAFLGEPRGAPAAGRPLRPAPDLVRTHLPGGHRSVSARHGPAAGRERGPEKWLPAHHLTARGHGHAQQRAAQCLLRNYHHFPSGPGLAVAARRDRGSPGLPPRAPGLFAAQAARAWLVPWAVMANKLFTLQRNPCACFGHCVCVVVEGQNPLEGCGWGGVCQGVRVESGMATGAASGADSAGRRPGWERLPEMGMGMGYGRLPHCL